MPPRAKFSTGNSTGSSFDENLPKQQQLLSNKVSIPWYKRYMHTLPEHEQIEFQPYEEIDKREEDIAMQFVYGEDVPEELDEQRMRQIRRQAVVQHLHYKERMENRQIMARGTQGFKTKQSIIDPNSAPSVTSILANRKTGNKLPDDFEGGKMLDSERNMCEAITSFLNKKRTITRRKRLMAEMKERGFSVWNSKWGILHRPAIRKEIATIYKAEHSARVRARLRRGINLVFACNRFIFILAELSGDTGNIVKGIREFQTQQVAMLDKNRQTNTEAKFIFEPKSYMLSSETPVPEAVLFILTKPWHDRTKQEVDLAVKSLQILRCFAELPASTQRYLATVAWSISIPEDKVMIRQGHEAQDYYILLSGRVSKTVFVGDPYGKDNGRFKFIRTYTKDSIFGEEALTKPGSERDYSVTSCIKCDILSINVHDYFKCSMTPSDIRSSAPDHIKFISHCQVLANFPKGQLIEDAEDNIYLAYFRPESVIEKKMSDSKWVYIVKWGRCRALMELPPSRKIRELHHADIFMLKNNEEGDQILMEDRMTEPLKVRVEVEVQDANRRNHILGIVNQEMSRAKKPAVDHNVYDSAVDDLREKRKEIRGLLLAKRNKNQREREAVEASRITIPNAKAPFKNPTIANMSRALINEKREKDGGNRQGLSYKPTSAKMSRGVTYEAIIREEDEGSGQGSSSTSIPKLPPITKSSSSVSDDSRRNSRRASCLAFEHEDSVADEEEKDEEEEEEESGYGIDHHSEYESTSSSILNVVGTRYNVGEVEELSRRKSIPHQAATLSFKADSPTCSEFSTSSSARRRQNTKKKSRISVDENLAAIPIDQKRPRLIPKNDPKAVKVPTATHSIWKLKKTFVKGDQAGFETINLEDGMYRPPDEDPALVSDGCELVMIRKELIQKYLGVDARQHQFPMT